MKNLYILLLGAGVLSATALTSCGEEKIVNEPGGPDLSENLTEYTVNATISSIARSKANVVGSTYVWNAKDKITIWNRNLGRGYDFSIAEDYSDENPSSEATFKGNAAIMDGYRLMALYPHTEKLKYEDATVFSIPDTCLQTGNSPELSDYTFMVAPATVVDGMIQDLVFSPMTSLVEFKIQNVSDEPMRLDYITLESDNEIFPASIQLDYEALISGLNKPRKHVTLNVSGKEIPVGGEMTAYMNLLPTASTSTKLLSSSTLLTVKLNATSMTTGAPVMYTGISTTPTELDMSESGFQFLPGKRYIILAELDKFEVPESGIMVDGQGVHIYTADGFRTWLAGYSGEYAGKNVKVETYFIDDNTLNVGTIDNPVMDFKNVFDGGGVTLSGISLTASGNSGLFVRNSGTIKNLNVSGEAVISDINAGQYAGMLVGENTGLIENCHVTGAQTRISVGTGSGGNAGALVGYNNRYGVISGCSVDGTTLTVSVKENVGGIAGENWGEIKGSYAGAGFNLVYSGSDSGSVGGLVGFNNGGKIKACYSVANMNVGTGANAGGLIGGTWATKDDQHTDGVVIASYSAATIQRTGGSIGGFLGDLGGVVRKFVIACYSTTTFAGNGGTVGAFAAKAGSLNAQCSECYYDLNNGGAIGAGGTLDGITGIQPEDFASKVQSMNEAIEKAYQNTGYRFAVNEDETKDRQPIILIKTDDGNSGNAPGFGEGGEF